MKNTVDKLIEQYNTLSEDEKVSLFLKLQDLDMREHYEPTEKKYRVEMLNIYGQHIVDRTFRAYSRKRLNRELHFFCLNQRHSDYDSIWAEAISDKKKRAHYKNTTCAKSIITEL